MHASCSKLIDVVHSIDLDIEGGSSDYFSNFVSTLRSLMDSGDKR